MTNETSWVIVDIDGTISDAGWRMNMAPNWELYHSESVHDVPYKDVVSLLQYLHSGFNIALVTRRNMKWRFITMQWLSDHHVPYQELIMCDDDDYRPAVELKRDIILTKFKDRNVLFALEDDSKIVDLYRSLGISTFQVRESQTV